MEISNFLTNIHWIPVLVVTIFSFVLGMAWHSAFLFGKSWKEEYQVFHDRKPLKIPFIFGGTGLGHFVAMAGISAVVSEQGAIAGMITGLIIALVWVLPVMAGTYLFANRSVKIWAIDFGMYLVLYALGGLILGLW